MNTLLEFLLCASYINQSLSHTAKKKKDKIFIFCCDDFVVVQQVSQFNGTAVSTRLFFAGVGGRWGGDRK